MWYTPDYPEEVFFEHWTFMAERYLDNPLVIGADLRNEVRYIEGNHFIVKMFLKKGKFYYARIVSEVSTLCCKSFFDFR